MIGNISIVLTKGRIYLFKVITKSVRETKEFAEEFAKRIDSGVVIAFFGGLGMGKTAFTSGFVKGRGIDAEVSSPTFALVHEYGGNPPVYHFDMYRVDSWEDLYSTSFFEYIDMDVNENDYEAEMEKYTFMNTGDLMILNAIANLERKCCFEEEEEYILEAIKVVKNAVIESGLIASQATKNNAVFSTIQEDISTR